jgi:4-hydroxybenzoate polyprenyltransferase
VKRHVDPILRLTRFPEYVWFVLITTLLGVAVGRGSFGWPLLTVLAANWLAVGFAFMINDVEDAPDDARDPAKVGRNPVSSGHLNPVWARWISFAAAVLSAALFATLGLWPFLTGLSCLAIAYLYSVRSIRLKAIPVADLVSHALMLAGLQFLSGYLTFAGGPAWEWVLPISFVMAISLYGQLYNQLRDLEGDQLAGVTHTASLLGSRAAHLLMMLWFVLGVVAAIGTVFVVHLIPTWVLLIMVVLAGALLVRPLSQVRTSQSVIKIQEPFQKPLEVAAAVALTAWFAGPWALAVIR